MKFIMFKGSLEEGVAPIYLFDGEEEYFKRRGEEMLKQKYLTEPSLNYSIFDGAELKGFPPYRTDRRGAELSLSQRKADRESGGTVSDGKRI